MMMSAVGRKNSTAARIQRLMEDVPVWAAAAIQRGPRTAAMLNNSTSQKPISRRSWDLGLVVSGCKRIPPAGKHIVQGEKKRRPRINAKKRESTGSGRSVGKRRNARSLRFSTFVEKHR